MKFAHQNSLSLAALALTAIIAAGCGSSSRKSTTEDAGAKVQETPVAENEATYATYRHDEAGDVDPASGEVKSQIPMARSGDPQPPDVEVTLSDTSVQRRDRVDVTARTTADAVEVVLFDGIGEKQALTYDESANVWRGSYRVPLRAPDRHGLSVTAKDGSNRWRRVWAFLDLTEQQPAAAVDSSSMSGEVSK